MKKFRIKNYLKKVEDLKARFYTLHEIFLRNPSNLIALTDKAERELNIS
jgi:hypothetical protein